MFYSFFKKYFSKNERFKTSILFCLLIGMIVLMRFFDAPLKNEIAPVGIVSFEFAKNLEKSIIILNSWNQEALISAKKSMYFDFLFLCIYATFIALIIFKLSRKLEVRNHILTEIMLAVVFIAAFFDVVENIALLQLIDGNYEQIWSSIAYYFAGMKFILLAIAIVSILVGSCALLFKKGLAQKE